MTVTVVVEIDCLRSDAVFDRRQVALAFDMLGLSRELEPKNVRLILGSLENLMLGTAPSFASGVPCTPATVMTTPALDVPAVVPLIRVRRYTPRRRKTESLVAEGA